MSNEQSRPKRTDISAWRADIPRKVLDPMSRCIEAIDHFHRRLQESLLRTFHRIGATLLENWDAVDEMTHVALIYRTDAWELLADRLDMDPRFLRDCLAFAREFNVAEVDALVACGVQWSHVVHLLGVRDVAKRWEYVRRIGENGLTTRQLYDELFGAHGSRSRSARRLSTPLTTPKPAKVTPKKALDKVTKFSRELETLFRPETDLARCLTADVLDLDQRDLVDQLRAECESLAKKLAHITSAINRTRCQSDRNPDNLNEAEPPRVDGGAPVADAAPKLPRKRRPPPATVT